MKSEFFQDWVKEEKEDTAIKLSQKHIINIIIERFVIAPNSIREQLEKITDIEVLDHLLIKAVTIPSIEEFQKLLRRATIVS